MAVGASLAWVTSIVMVLVTVMGVTVPVPLLPRSLSTTVMTSVVSGLWPGV